MVSHSHPGPGGDAPVITTVPVSNNKGASCHSRNTDLSAFKYDSISGVFKGDVQVQQAMMNDDIGEVCNHFRIHWDALMKKKSNTILILCIIIGGLLLLSVSVPVSAGNSLTVTGELVPSSGPHADFSATPLSGTAPLIVRFTDQSSGTIRSYQWDFTNDGRFDNFIKNPVHVYGTPGTYSVGLKVAGPDGIDELIKESYITVTAPVRPPVARFTQDRMFGFAPLPVRFTDRSLNGPTEYLWTFGDGGSSTMVSPTHSYAKSGFYRVTLKVSNQGGTSTSVGFVYVLQNWRGFYF
jgi:PKD repeat protein